MMKFDFPEIEKISFVTESVATLNGEELDNPIFQPTASGDLA